MRFSCPTLDVLLYQVLQVSEQLCRENVGNAVLYEVLRVSGHVSVILWSYYQRRYETFCVCYYQSVLLDSVCLCSMDFVSGLKNKILK